MGGKDEVPGEQSAEGPVVLTNWAFERVGTLMVLCSVGPDAPPEPDFNVWLARIKVGDFDRMLIYSEGGSPSVKQRAQIAETWQGTGREAHVALLTDSTIARGLLTAIQWLLGRSMMKALPLAELNNGLVWLNAADSSREVAQVIARLRAALRRKDRDVLHKRQVG